MSAIGSVIVMVLGSSLFCGFPARTGRDLQLSLSAIEPVEISLSVIEPVEITQAVTSWTW
jgi:hypothetical protein